jgi:prepilin-type N-terminal cleavage/methylation domain-containing protein
MAKRGSGQEDGFTLVELLAVIAIMTVLMSMGTLFFNKMQTKSFIEKEVNTIYTTLMTVRLEALYAKTGRVVTFSGRQFNIYSSAVITTTPISSTTLTYPVVLTGGANRVEFDSSGMMNDSERAICVQPGGSSGENAGNVDAVDVSAVKVFMGKRNTGASCDPASIRQK